MKIQIPGASALSFAGGLLAATFLTPAHGAVDFTKEVLPVLQSRCIGCHGPEKQKAKLRLDSKDALLKGGKDGEVIKVGDAGASEIYKRIILPKDNDDRMPPEGEPLAAELIEVLKKWIDEGASWPEGVVIKPAPSTATATATPAGEPSEPARPKVVVPAPELPKDFKPSPAETAALAALAKNGIPVRPVAQNVPWHEVNLRPLGTNVTDEAVAPLKDVESLIEVRLGATKVTDASLATLASLPNLQVLGLELTGVTDAGTAHLAGLTNLTSLNLYGTAVTDAGLVHLEGLKYLRSLYLWQTKVTPEGVKRLKEKLPGLDINTGAALAAVASSTNAPAEKKEEPKK